MTRVHRTARAADDLAEIWAYIARDNPEEADRFYESLEWHFDLLAKLPSIGRDRAELEKGLRSMPVGDYIVFYRRVRQGILVVRVLHARRDLPAQFERVWAPRAPHPILTVPCKFGPPALHFPCESGPPPR